MPRWTQVEYLSHLGRELDRQGGVPADEARGERPNKERELHDQIESECIRRGWIVIHSRMDRPTTVKIGCADFVILADGGRTFTVECKTKGKLTPAQQAWLAWARKLSHKATVIRSLAEFIDFVK